VKPSEQGKILKIMVQFSNSNSAMETGDHSKNGVSPKNQMSRGNFLRKACFTVLAIAFSLMFVACSKDDDKGTKDSKVSKSEAKQEFDQSNYGIYRGVFVGSSGVVAVNLGNNGNSPFAILIIDGVTLNFTTTQTVTQGTNTTILFKQGNNSFVFSVNADGTNPKVTEINITGHLDAQMIVAKEISSVVAECYEGTFTGPYSSGTINTIICGNKIMGLAYGYGSTYVCEGQVNNNSISGLVVFDVITFEGKKQNETISGTWTHPRERGTWTGTRKYITTYE
jgi:hypothetical protein